MLVLGDFVIFHFNLISYSPWTSASSSVKLRRQKTQFQSLCQDCGVSRRLNQPFCLLPFAPSPQRTPTSYQNPYSLGLRKAFPCKTETTKETIIKLTVYIKRRYEQIKRQMTNWKRYLHCTEKCQHITKNLSKGHNRQFTHLYIHTYHMYMCCVYIHISMHIQR